MGARDQLRCALPVPSLGFTPKVARAKPTRRTAEPLRSALEIKRLLAMSARYGATGMHHPMFLNGLATAGFCALGLGLRSRVATRRLRLRTISSGSAKYSFPSETCPPVPYAKAWRARSGQVAKLLARSTFGAPGVHPVCDLHHRAARAAARRLAAARIRSVHCS
jgi:hypothetical protein